MKLKPHWKFSLLLKARARRRRIGYRTLYENLLRRYEDAGTPVPAKLYGYAALLNPGNQYPFIIQDYPLFNAPLAELTYQAFNAKGSPLRFVDVGAATGETVFLVKQKCPGQVEAFVCIDGDTEFFSLLSHNMAQFHDVRLVQAVLSRKATQIRSLVKHHSGTAAAVGEGSIKAIPLDDVEEVRRGKVDILKIDVDGFDGAVLAGGKEVLATDRPAVIFEWHPALLRATENEPTEAFSTLAECGYRRYLWFTNSGSFSHFTDTVTHNVLRKTEEYLLRVNNRSDEHFDVVALPDESKIDEVALAATAYARAR